MIRTRHGALVAAATLALALTGCKGNENDTGAPQKSDSPSPAPAQEAKVRQAGEAAPSAVPQVPTGNPQAANPHAANPHAANPHAANPQAGQMPAGHPPTGQQMPAGHPPAGSQPSSAASGPVKGTIKLDDTVKDGAGKGKTLFIIVRQDAGPGQKGGLLAAKKVAVTGPEMFPLQFEITPADLMFPGSQLAGKLRISARVDADGDAISKNPGDVIGAAPNAVDAGSDGVEVVLDGKI